MAIRPGAKKATSLTISHQIITVILLPVCTALVGVCTFFLSEIYGEYKLFKTTTESFRAEQVLMDERQNVNIKSLQISLAGILPKQHALPSPPQ